MIHCQVFTPSPPPLSPHYFFQLPHYLLDQPGAEAPRELDFIDVSGIFRDANKVGPADNVVRRHVDAFSVPLPDIKDPPEGPLLHVRKAAVPLQPPVPVLRVPRVVLLLDLQVLQYIQVQQIPGVQLFKDGVLEPVKIDNVVKGVGDGLFIDWPLHPVVLLELRFLRQGYTELRGDDGMQVLFLIIEELDRRP